MNPHDAIHVAAKKLVDAILEKEIRCGDNVALHAWVDAAKVYTLANELRRLLNVHPTDN